MSFPLYFCTVMRSQTNNAAVKRVEQPVLCSFQKWLNASPSILARGAH